MDRYFNTFKPLPLKSDILLFPHSFFVGCFFGFFPDFEFFRDWWLLLLDSLKVEEWFSPVVPYYSLTLSCLAGSIYGVFTYILDGLNCFNLKHTCNSTNSTRNGSFPVATRKSNPIVTVDEKTLADLESKPNYWPIYKHQNTVDSNIRSKITSKNKILNTKE